MTIDSASVMAVALIKLSVVSFIGGILFWTALQLFPGTRPRMRKLKQYSEFGYHAGMALLFLSLVVDRFWGGIQCQIN